MNITFRNIFSVQEYQGLNIFSDLEEFIAPRISMRYFFSI